jgi:hypothetical protein
MLVTPSPVSLLIVVFEFGEIGIFAMGLFGPRAICPIFLTIPFMIVVMFLVVIGVSGPVILGAQSGWRKCDRSQKRRSEYCCVPETGCDYFHTRHKAIGVPDVASLIGSPQPGQKGHAPQPSIGPMWPLALLLCLPIGHRVNAMEGDLRN